MSNSFALPKAIEDALRSVNPAISRRGFLAASGAVVVTVGLGAITGGRALAQDAKPGPYVDPDFLKPFEGKAESLTVREGDQKTVPLKLIPADAQ